MTPLWPRLGSLPMTTVMLLLVVGLWAVTGVSTLAFALVTCLRGPAHIALTVPDRWYTALETLTGIIVIQFAAKRATHAELWKRAPVVPAPATTETK